MSDRTPAEALARARWDRELDPDHPWYVAWDDVSPRLRQEQVEFAEADIELLAAAGFRVVPIPDDNTRALAARLRELLDAANKADRPHRYPHHVADCEVLVWKCARCGEWIRESGKRTSCAAAPPPAKLYVPSALIDAAAAYLDGQPQDRPGTCPNPECDEGVIRPSGNCGFDDDGAMLEIPCPDAWHGGGSGDTR